MRPNESALTRACCRATRAALLTAATLIAACATAPEAHLSLDDARLATTAEAREDSLQGLLGDLERERLSLAPPPYDQRLHPTTAGFWFARVLAHSPAVRAALASWRVACAATASAGAPAPVDVGLTDHDFGGDDPLVELLPMFDVLGHLGVGPASAERAAARAEERLAIVRVERAAFEAWLEAERARVALAASHALDAAMAGLAAEVDADLPRWALLARHGRIGDADAAASAAMAAELARRRSEAHEAALVARTALARAAGLAPDHPALDAVVAEAPSAPAPGTGPLRDDELEAHPFVREQRRRFEAAEAEVRRAAALAWPGIGFGPHLARDAGYGIDDLRIGGMLRLELPFPSRWRGALDAAVARRAGVIAAYEDVLLDLRQRAADAAARLSELESRRPVTASIADSSAAAWTAARAGFLVGRTEPAMWRDALATRMGAIEAQSNDAQARALATLDLVLARGPVATPFHVAPSSAEVAP